MYVKSSVTKFKGIIVGVNLKSQRRLRELKENQENENIIEV